MKVLLIGIGGCYNYGCEAIVRGTVEKLRSMFPSIEIDYASSRVEDDQRRLRGCEVNVIERYRITPRILCAKIFNKLKIANNIYYDNIRLVSNYSAVFSIGGDLYTLDEHRQYPRLLVAYGDACVKKGIPFILWGCSVGPFGKEKHIIEIMRKHLSNISLIVAREQVTIDYLSSIGIADNVVFSMDPAFYVSSPKKIKVFRKNLSTIGLNLSPLSLAHFGISREDAIREHVSIIKRIIAAGRNVILLPHVISEFDGDNDLAYLQQVYNELNKQTKSKVILVDSDPGFIGIKQYILKCDLIFTARMHCGINAICCGVPVYFLSYSEKSRGMARLIYGKESFSANLKDFGILIDNILKNKQEEQDIAIDDGLMDMTFLKETLSKYLSK